MKIRQLSLVIILISLLYSCAPFNPSIMFQTPDDFAYDTPSEVQNSEYVISANDILSFRLFTNNGFKLIDVTNENMQQVQQLNIGIEYLIEYDSIVNLPIIGRVKIAGKTLREAELFLESLYEEVYIDPFIMLDITNRRVTIFPGNEGLGRVITLENNNVMLLEALAQAGGLTERGKANRIKLIRGDLRDPEIYLIDLSTIEGLKDANIVLQANDIIYVEPEGTTVRQVINESAPTLAFVTSLVTLFVILQTLD